MATRSRKNSRNRQDTLHEHTANKETEATTTSNIDPLQGLKPLQTEISKLSNQISVLMGVFNEVKELKSQLKEKDIVIASLAKRVDELEQYSRRQNIVITGLNTNHKSYSRVTQVPNNETDHENASEKEKQSLETKVINFLTENVIAVSESEIEACHTLPTKHDGPKPIIVRFVSRKSKSKVMRNLKSIRENNRKLGKNNRVFINDHLTKKNNDIAAHARKLRNNKVIASTYVQNCIVHIKTVGATPEQSKIMQIHDFEDFNKHGLVLHKNS